MRTMLSHTLRLTETSKNVQGSRLPANHLKPNINTIAKAILLKFGVTSRDLIYYMLQENTYKLHQLCYPMHNVFSNTYTCIHTRARARAR